MCMLLAPCVFSGLSRARGLHSVPGRRLRALNPRQAQRLHSPDNTMYNHHLGLQCIITKPRDSTQTSPFHRFASLHFQVTPDTTLGQRGLSRSHYSYLGNRGEVMIDM